MLVGVMLLLGPVVSFWVFSQWADRCDSGPSWLVAGFVLLVVALLGLESCIQLIG